MSSAKGARVYYARIFAPLAMDVVMWGLGTMGGEFELRRREICFRCAHWNPTSGDSYYLRNRVYEDPTQVEQILCSAQARALTIEFGSIYAPHSLPEKGCAPPEASVINEYDARPYHFEGSRAIKAGISCALGELVLDVDLEHDPLRPDACYDRAQICACAEAKKVCDACWEAFMIPAQQALEWAICKFFGFRRVFCVFSGRRGFHMWICDPRVVRMTQPERLALVAALRAPISRADRAPDAFSDGMYAVLAPLFDAHPVLRHRYTAPADRSQQSRAHRAAVFAALWPRIDEPVAMGLRHLHKVPFVLHPSTSCVCVLMGSASNADERFVPSRDTFVAHNCDATALHTVVRGSVAMLRKVLKE